jgi:hypothetical protein
VRRPRDPGPADARRRPCTSPGTSPAACPVLPRPPLCRRSPASTSGAARRRIGARSHPSTPAIPKPAIPSPPCSSSPAHRLPYSLTQAPRLCQESSFRLSGIPDTAQLTAQANNVDTSSGALAPDHARNVYRHHPIPTIRAIASPRATVKRTAGTTWRRRRFFPTFLYPRTLHADGLNKVLTATRTAPSRERQAPTGAQAAGDAGTATPPPATPPAPRPTGSHEVDVARFPPPEPDCLNPPRPPPPTEIAVAPSGWTPDQSCSTLSPARAATTQSMPGLSF